MMTKKKKNEFDFTNGLKTAKQIGNHNAMF